MAQTETGYIIKISKLKEADSIVTILTRHHGKRSYYLKNVFASKSKRRQALEILNLVEFHYSDTKSSDQMAFINSLSIISNTKIIKSSENFFAEAFLVSEFIDKLDIDVDDARYTFELFGQLSDAINIDPGLAMNFVLLKCLSHFGFLPELNTCTRTSKKIEEDDQVILNIDTPGYHTAGEENTGVETVPIRLIKVQNYIIKKETDLEMVARLNLSKNELKQLSEIDLNWVEMILERELKSRKLLI